MPRRYFLREFARACRFDAGGLHARLWKIVRLLAFHAVCFCTAASLALPKKPSRFVECRNEYVLEEAVNPYQFAKLRV